jgi:hypothetical protein
MLVKWECNETCDFCNNKCLFHEDRVNYIRHLCKRCHRQYGTERPLRTILSKSDWVHTT